MHKQHTQPNILVGKPFMLERKVFNILASQSSNVKCAKLAHLTGVSDDIAIIKIHGPLSKHSSVFDHMFGMTSYDSIKRQLDTALADDKVSGIILDIDSPGGEVAGNFDLADHIYGAREKKTIWAVANEEAYSAAYAIASSAEKVFLSRTSGVGSVGVIASHVDQSAFDEKCGVKITTIFAGERKNDLSPHEALKPEAAVGLQKLVDRFYGMFVDLVARNRKLTEKQIKQTEAGLFYGEEAVAVGFADEVMTLSEVKNLMLSINQPRSFKMSKTENNMEQAMNVEAIEQKAFAEGQAAYREKVLAIVSACTLAKMPEKLESFIEQDISLTDAKDALMKALADRQTNTSIVSHVVPVENKGQENPVLALAKKQAVLS